MDAVLAALRGAGARTRRSTSAAARGSCSGAADANRRSTEIVGVDVSSARARGRGATAAARPDARRQRERISCCRARSRTATGGSAGFDAAAVVEVIEHLDPPRLAAFERVVFERARPRTVVVTTPNVEYNVRFETLAAGELRHRDHRFEWTRAEFEAWANGVAERHGYARALLGPSATTTPRSGPPTQMAVFTR